MNRMLKFYRNTDKKILLFSVVIFSAFALLAYLFPYSGDDWAWGSEIGAERLQNWFEGYNGRYAGNLLVMTLTRSKGLCVFVMALCLVLAGLFPSLFAGVKGLASFALGTVFLLVIPGEVFTQSVVWTSGFSNYVPPALLTLFYFIITKNIFGNEIPHYRAFVPFVSLFMGFAGALFMENITVFNIMAALCVIIFTFVRFRKVFAVHIAYFVGSVAGAVLMFTNSAYRLIAQKGDFYRSFFYERGFVDMATENIKETFEQFFASNPLALSFLSVLCILLCITFLKSNQDSKKKTAVIASVYVNLICLGLICFKGRLYDWDIFYNNRIYAVVSAVMMFCIGMLYFLAVAVIICFCIDCKKVKGKAVFLLFCIVGVVAPLMVVSPIGPRCFFPPYLFLSCLCVLLFSYLSDRLAFSEKVQMGFQRLFVGIVCALCSFLVGVYGVIHYYDVTRTEYIKKQTDEGFKNVVTYYLPFTSYVWNGDPDSVPWDESYKKFYGIDEKVKFKFILWDAFKSFKENFEKK